MSARASARLLRFARMELRHGLRWKATLDAWRRASGRRISGCWVAAFVVVAVLWATVSFGIARGALVEWADPPIAPVTVLAWLLWSLGGLYAAAAAFVTGWATWDD